MKRRWIWAVLVAASWGIVSCDEVPPTSLDDDGFPVDPRTVEVVLPFADFAESLTVYGGYGTAADLGGGVVASAYRGTLEARTLVRFGPYPFRASVRDSLGTIRADSNFTFVGGRVVARLDTLSSTNGEEPVTLALGALTTPWHSRSATWTLAVDTSGEQRAWPEPGAGPIVPVAEGEWLPAEGDSVVIEVDSATVARWADTTDASRGLRIDLVTAGERVDVNSVTLRLDARPNIHQDTLVTLTSSGTNLTFIYDPVPEPPPDGIRIGGTPAWRTVVRTNLPRVLDGPPSLCAALGCPFTLDPGRVNHASLILTSRAVEPAAFQPTDTVRLDVRTVLAPDRLPKSPLGSSFVGSFGHSVPPSAFGDEAGVPVAIPVTTFVRALLAPDTAATPPPTDLALLSLLEPLSLAFASFVGPGEPGAPVLRLIITAPDTVELR